jgi:peptidoglycan/xylan/chitin deacetylase (PgdA/CDA1 family)
VRAILTFHGVDPSGSVLSIAPRELESLLEALERRGFAIVPLDAIAAGTAPEDAVSLTFDDGFASVHDAALPVLRAAGPPASLFLTTGFLGRDNRWPGQPSFAPVFPLLDWKGVEALARAGVTIEAHTVHHPDLRRLSDAALEDELAGCDDAIEKRIGRAPRAFAYPYGFVDERVAGAARRRYGCAVTTELAALRGGEDPHRLPRLDAFYLRDVRVHRRFGGLDFRAWLGARALARGLRARLAPLHAG